MFDKTKTDIKSPKVGKAICGGLRFDKAALPNARLGKNGWVQCYIDQRAKKAQKDLKCSALVMREKVCKDLGGVKANSYGCYHGKTGDKFGAAYAYNDKGKEDVVQKSCSRDVQHKLTFKEAKFDDDETTFGVCVQCKEVGCWCKDPKKSGAIACLDGSERGCGAQKCIKEGVFKKKSYQDACAIPKKGFVKTATIKTWFLPEKMSWKIMIRKGRDTVCRSKPYNKWYSTYVEDITRCRLTPGVAYILQCRDKFGSGWAGGSISIQGLTYCGDSFKFKGGYQREKVFVVKKR